MITFIKQKKEVGYAEEILITKTDLEEKNQIMNELRNRVNELKTESEYQLRLKEMSSADKMKELTEKFIQEMESLKTKNQVLKAEKEKSDSKHESETAAIYEKQNKELQDLENTNNQKLMMEYEKYQDLQSKTQKIQEEYERQISEMEQSRVKGINDMQEKYEEDIHKLNNQIEKVKIRFYFYLFIIAVKHFFIYSFKRRLTNRRKSTKKQNVKSKRTAILKSLT